MLPLQKCYSSCLSNLYVCAHTAAAAKPDAGDSARRRVPKALTGDARRRRRVRAHSAARRLPPAHLLTRQRAAVDASQPHERRQLTPAQRAAVALSSPLPTRGRHRRGRMIARAIHLSTRSSSIFMYRQSQMYFNGIFEDASRICRSMAQAMYALRDMAIGSS